MSLTLLGTGSISTEEYTISLKSSGIVIPKGNTALRPTNPDIGTFRFNTETNKFELYNGSTWTSITDTIGVDLNFLIAAGGGGGGYSTGGGGGAGSIVVGKIPFTGFTLFTVTSIGGGGSGTPGIPGGNGSNTSVQLSSNSIITITAVGGGGASNGPGAGNGRDGGSGGGGSAGPGSIGGTGNIIAGYNHPGGRVGFPGGSGGGGGGATSAGIPVALTGNGGNAYLWLNGKYYGGGGGGFPGGKGGSDIGGGTGPATGLNANVNTASGGGGGASGWEGGNGSSGLILLAHPNTITNAFVSTGLTYTTNTNAIYGNILYEITAGSGFLLWR